MNAAVIDKTAGAQDAECGAGEYVSFRIGSEGCGIETLKSRPPRGLRLSKRFPCDEFRLSGDGHVHTAFDDQNQAFTALLGGGILITAELIGLAPHQSP